MDNVSFDTYLPLGAFPVSLFHIPFGECGRTNYPPSHEHMVMARVWLPPTPRMEHVTDMGHIRDNHLVFQSVFDKNNDKMTVVYVNEIILQAKPSSAMEITFGAKSCEFSPV